MKWPVLITNRTIAAFCAAMFSGALYGYVTGIVATLVVALKDDWDLSSIEQGIFGGSSLIGALLGSMFSGPLADKFGRRPVLVFTGLIATVGSIGGAFTPAGNSIPHAVSVVFVCVMRAVVGVSLGTSLIGPVYTTEVAPDAKTRGLIVVMFQLLVTFTIFVSYAVGSALESWTPDDWSWRWMFISTLLFSVPMAVLGACLPESNVWSEARQLKQERREKHVQTDNAPLLPDGSSASSHRYPDESGSDGEDLTVLQQLKLMSTKHKLISFLGLTCAIVNQWTGINAVIFYGPSIMKSAGVPELIATMAIGGWNFVVTFAATFLVDRLGRRTLQLTGTGIVVWSLGLIIIGFAFTEGVVKSALVLFGVAVYLFGFEFGPGPLFFLLVSEMFPPEIRGMAMGVFGVAVWLLNLVVALVFPPLNAFEPWIAFLIFFIIGWFALAVFVIWLPETKGNAMAGSSGSSNRRGRDEVTEWAPGPDGEYHQQ